MSVILKLSVVLIDCLTLITNFNILYYWSLSKDNLNSIYEIFLLSLFYAVFQSHLSNSEYNYLLIHLLAILLITVYVDVFRDRQNLGFQRLKIKIKKRKTTI